MIYDMPLEQLKTYLPDRKEPEDFDDFWQGTLAEAHSFPLNAIFELVDFGLSTLDTFDVTFNGYGGQPIKGWFMIPRHRTGRLPCVVEYIGYAGGRGTPYHWLLWSSVGYAHLVMDTRGQGSMWIPGDTPDNDMGAGEPQYPGFMTRGILEPNTYFYRRVFTDAVRAVEAAQSFPEVDHERIVITGGSQGGGITLAVSGLANQIFAAMPDVPFLCNFRRATDIVDTAPYNEIVHYCQIHRDKVDNVFNTLSYFDGMNFAVRAKAQALFSVGLMDTICPPSTVFAAYNYYAGSKNIRIYKYNNHEGGDIFQTGEKVQFLKRLFG